MLGPVSSQFIERYPDDAARVLEEAASETRAKVLEAVSAPTGAALLRSMTPHAAAASLSCLAPGKAAEVAALLPLELAAALSLRLDAASRGALLNTLPGRVSVPLRLMLRFPPGSVGSLIDPRVATLRSNTRIGEAAEIARRAPELLRKYLYVLDEAQRLTGVVDARHCLLQDPERPIASLERRDPVALRARANIREARLNPAWERFPVLPAVDHRGVFLGVVRRMSLFQAIAAEPAEAPKESLTDLALALAELYWEAMTGLLHGALREERTRSTSRSG